MMTSKEIRKLAEIWQGNYQTVILNVLADVMERLEDLDRRIPVIHKQYLEHK